MPKQISLPNLKQLQSMLAESLKTPGHMTQLPFGDPPEELLLGCFKDRGKGDYHWSLNRLNGETAMLVWEQLSADPAFIHQMIVAQFPSFDGKPVTLRAVGQSAQSQSGQQAQYQTNPPGTSANIQSQSVSTTMSKAATQSAYEKQSTTSRMRGKATLEGNLENMAMPNVLQSVGMSKGTGRLEVENMQESATVYFDDGNPIHCVLGNLEGAPALIELVGWEQGDFRFYPEPKYENVTIKKRLDMMLMEGAALEDQYRLLKQKNISDQSYLLRNHPSITEQLFEQLLEKGTGADMTLQKRIYQVIDNKSRLLDVLRKFNVSKQKWVPIIFNFATCNLVTFVDELPDSMEKPQQEADIDWSQARAAEQFLLRPDTGLYSYQAFLYLLEREFQRFERFGRPVAVILLELSVRAADPNGVLQPLPVAAIKEVAERINKMKRKTDLFAHYEPSGFALLLPETESTSAKNFAGRMAEMLMTTPLSSKFGGSPVVASVGVGAIPDDCPNIGSMLAMARPQRPT